MEGDVSVLPIFINYTDWTGFGNVFTGLRVGLGLVSATCPDCFVLLNLPLINALPTVLTVSSRSFIIFCSSSTCQGFCNYYWLGFMMGGYFFALPGASAEVSFNVTGDGSWTANATVNGL